MTTLRIKTVEKNADGEPVDRRLQWLEFRISAALKLKPIELKKLMENEDNRMHLLEFLDVADCRKVFVVGTSSSAVPYVVLNGEYDHTKRYSVDLKRKVMYFIKNKKEKLVDEKVYAEKIHFGDLNVDVLQSLYEMSKNIMLPLMQLHKNLDIVPDVHYCNIIEQTHTVLAQSLVTLGKSHNRTLLPLPPVKLANHTAESKEETNKELVHELERAAMVWLEMIREAVNSSPESLSDPPIVTDPNAGPAKPRISTPHDEIQFWEDKQANLHQLEEQLTRPFILKTMVILHRAGSAYHSTLQEVCAELHETLCEANENARYLRPLTPYINSITPGTNEKLPLEHVSEEGAFKRIFALLLTIWKDSKTFSTIPRMVHFISEICNELMVYCIDALDGVDIFNAEPEDAMKLLTNILNVCGDFKAAFFEAKSRAAKELPRPWKFQNSALFRRLDTLLERFHDLLDITETSVLFNKSVNIRIGGSDSIALSNQIDKVYEKYMNEHHLLAQLPVESLYDINDNTFDRVYTEYRRVVNTLEQELSTICNTACKEAQSIPHLFKVIDSFEGFAARPVGRQDWQNRQPDLIRRWHTELLSVQEQLSTYTTDDKFTTLFPNVPPTTAILMWGQGLLQRLGTTYNRMQDLDTNVLLSTKAVECLALHEQLMKRIQRLTSLKFDSWAASVGQLSIEKLNSNLLAYNNEKREFIVNFDSFLAMTLKEAVYLEAKSEEDECYVLPQQVVAINKSRDVLRCQLLRLTHICNTINQVNHNLKPMEIPLVQEEASVISDFLMRAVNDLKWSSTELAEDFIADGLQQVNRLEREVNIIKYTLANALKIISDFAAEDHFLPLVPTRSESRVMSEHEFKKKINDFHAARRDKMHSIATEVKSTIDQMLNDLNSIKSSSQLTPIDSCEEKWSRYLVYFSDELCKALVGCTIHSLQGLKHQLDPTHIQSHSGMPLLDVKLILSRPANNRDVNAPPNLSEVTFDPPLLTSDRFIANEVQKERERMMSNVSPNVTMNATTMTDETIQVRQMQRLHDMYPGGKIPTVSVESLVDQYLENIISLNEEFPRVDDSSISYRGDVEVDGEIISLRHSIRQLVDETVKMAECEVERFEEYSYLFTDNIAKKFNAFLEIKAQEEVDRYHDPIQGPKVVPYFSGVPLSEFEARIKHYEELHDVLGDLPMNRTSGFLKIDTKPIRNTLLDLCSRWRDAYTDHIINKTMTELESLYAFINEAEKELQSDVIDSDLDTLKKAMRCIRDCRRRNAQVELMLNPMNEAVAMLKRHPNCVREATLEAIEELRKPAHESWNTLYRKSLNTREQHSSAQDRESQHVKNQTTMFENKIISTGEDMRLTALYKFELPRDESYVLINKWAAKLHDLEQEAQTLLDLQELFELSPSEFREMRESRSELVILKHMWDFVCHVCTLFEDWMRSPFAFVDVEGFLDEIRHLQKQLKGQPLKAKDWDVYKGLYDSVQNMNKSLPLCAELRTPAMRDRHWVLLLATANQEGSIDPHAEDFTLQNLIELGIHRHSEEIYNIVEKAQKELIIERALAKIEDTWSKLAVEYDFNKDLSIMLLANVDNIVEQLEADSNILQSMLANRFVEFFLSRVQLWQRNLSTIDTCLVKWVEIQRKWVNLYPIFVLSADIREQLPEDAIKFREADDLFRHVMQSAHETNNVIELLCTNVVLERMSVNIISEEDISNPLVAQHIKVERANQQPGVIPAAYRDLEQYLNTVELILVGCEKALSEYLETKRKIFPRFFFVSSADLVDILSKGSDPRAVMVHMSKVVDSIETFLFDPSILMAPYGGVLFSPTATVMMPPTSNNPKAVYGIESTQGEVIKLSEEFICDGAVETWLLGCITAMQKSIRMHISDAISGYTDRPRTEWIYMYPCQAIICTSRSYFTAETNSAFQLMEEGNESALKDHLKQQKQQLDVLIKEVLTPKEENVRKMLVHLITIDVHNRDIVQSLVDDKVDSVEAFQWQSQLRYYWDEKRGSEIRICDAEFVNGYEYVGLCGCLVITKLTDRCYITLSQALRLKKGGAPAGPAGTGKTETTKDLARNLGVACYVFNCSDQMNYVTLGQVFKGLTMSGSWGCFDEFNRISIDVLSVVATQVNSILNALKGQKARFRFMDEEIPVDNRVGLFITMNPGYAGRTELPENIKSLFRPCAMVVPDLKNICEIMLAAEGFGDAKDLALKFVTLYRLNRELLSPQDHYDWGLRAVKSVLYIAGALKRSDTDVPERRVLMRALRDTNLAKLSKDDVYVFMGLIRCLFPNLDVPKKAKVDLDAALHKQCKEMGNFPGDNDIFILKCSQYEEILHVRHSVFILGAAGAGKTQCWKCLQGALGLMGNHAVSTALNPKAITTNELYGFIHPQTKEWKDGVLSNIFRQYALESKIKKNSKWIVLDGIVDAEWIESMNTVMDDNKMLTLVSNERIPLTDSMRMIFEVSQLRNASPATVSRGGVVFINETDLGYVPFRDKWLMTRDNREAMMLETFFDRYLPPAFEYYKRSLKTIVPIMDIAIVQTICFLLEGLLKDLQDRSTDVYEKYFAFALIWAFGGPLPSDGRIDYRYQFSTWWKKENPNLKMNENGTVFDYYLDASEKYEFKPWADLVKSYQHDPDLPLSVVSVQTADTVRMNSLCSYLIDNAKPVMLIGTAGTGKSNIMMAKLRSLDPNSIMYRVIAFNARTNAASLQGIMEQNLEKRSGRVYGPLNRKKLIFFMDDMNMPAPDKYGTQESIALLQQHINYGFWFDRVKMTPKEIHDVRYVAAMNPKSGAFTILDRLLRHYAVFSTNMPDKSDLTRIYGQILRSHLTLFPHSINHLCDNLTNATIELHTLVAKNFLPTAILFHYQWNMRELFNIFQGLCSLNPKLHKEGQQVVRLWAHECQRTFRDRMPVETDINKFDDLLLQVQRDYFTEIPQENLISKGLWAPLRTTREGDENVYDECDTKFTEHMLISRLAEYNSNVATMDLVLFDQAIEHVCRIARVLNNSRGNALLVGVGGSGKQSLAKLASYILSLEVAQILVTSTYNISSFRTDVQEIYKKCGLKSISHTFLITDQQIVSEDMLMYINDILNSGNIPDLFIGDERDNVIGSIMNEVKASGNSEYSNPDVCWEFFIDKTRVHLHMVLCMSPISPKFAPWCRQFPALSNTTVINWFHPWPEQALQSVAYRFLKDENLGDRDAKKDIADFIAECHDIVTNMSDEFFMATRRRCYTTPKSFLETIQLYKELLHANRNKVERKQERLQAGIQKIQDAAAQVAGLQEVLVKESVEVEEARQKTEAMMEHVGQEKSVVEQQREIARVEEGKTNKIVQEVESFAAECERDLAAARPLVEEAKRALNTLDKSHLTELKSMARPPDDVVMVCAAVRVLTSDPTRIPAARNCDWANCKLMMGNVTTWMKDLLAFDQDNIPQACVDAIQPYVTNAAFDAKSVVTKSFAAAGLCKWVIGMNAYHVVRCQVRPKEQRLAEARDRLATSRAQLKRIQDKVAELEGKLDILIAQYDEANNVAKAIEARARKTRLKTDLAERLVNGLSGEKVRWGKTIEELKERAKLLVGDVLLASAFVSYVAPFTKDFRTRIVEECWRPRMHQMQIAMTKDLDPVLGLLAAEADIAGWLNDGLQSDPVSVQNGAIVINCSRWPLIIDPQLQGIRWIKTQQERNGLVVVQPGQKRWFDKLIDCIENGLPCLIEGCDETLDPVLDNVLGRVTYRRGNRTLIRVGARDAEFNPKFKLFLQTRLSNPNYSPEINAQTTLVNFTVTESGLEDQLLAVVVNHDRRDLEEKRSTLIRNVNVMTIELQQCEDTLLVELSNASGDILENVTLIENLENTKRKATDISRGMTEAVATQKKIAVSRASYQPSAARGALLFFQIDLLGKIDHMYQYSLEAFMTVFNKALSEAPHPEDNTNIAERVQNVSRVVTEYVYAYVARGMFERHKLILSAMITFAILLKSNEIHRKQLDFLLQGKKKTIVEQRPESVKEWCNENNWAATLALAEVEGSTPPFSHLPQDMTDSNRWKVWQNSERPEEEKMPTDWKALNSFQRLLVLRCLRPDRLSTALETFVSNTMGKFFISDQTIDLDVSFKGSSPINPLFFILSPGVDPVRAVEALGIKMGYTYDNAKLYNVSLGQGQEIVAERALQACFSHGGWCMLNNVHLVEKWLRVFEKTMEQYNEVYGKMAAIEREKAVRRAARKQIWLNELKTANEHQSHAYEEKSTANEEGERNEDIDETAEGVPIEEEYEDDNDDADLDDPNLVKGSLEFRIFLSAEPSTTIPISLLQRSIKLTSEPPTGIKQNVARALRCFSDEPWEKSAKPTEYRCIMFAMCFFHAVVVERKKFGPQGWNRVYPYNVGDLTTCLEVAANYIEDRPKTPWEDLRYVFGEIMYGGHITDDWDRVLCMAYLNQWIVPEVTDGLELAGGFLIPPPMSYVEYEQYIEENCPEESPVLYGLHPNAEINYRTVQAQTLFRHIAELQPKSTGPSGDKGRRKSALTGEVESTNDAVHAIVDDLTEKLPEPFNLVDISDRLDEERSPTQHVFYQECERTNILIECVRNSLRQMSLGLKGELSMSTEMEEVLNELQLGRVPELWMRYSFASVRPLATWFDNLLQRYSQCNDWTAELTNPKVILLNLFFNPMSLLTALMQQTSIANSYDLDQMGLLVEPTKKIPDQIDVPARDGAFIYGLVMEGARWDSNSNTIEESRSKELYPKMPVITIRALPLSKLDRRDQYECPVYKTQARGHTFVVGLHLRTKAPARRWTIAGAGLILDISE